MLSSNEKLSDSDSDDGFTKDMEALKRACQITGRSNTDKLQLSRTNTNAVSGDASDSSSLEDESDGEEVDDLELLHSIEKRFAVSPYVEPLTLKPLCTLPPDWSDTDDCEDDLETLRVIQRRFAAYNDDISEPAHQKSDAYGDVCGAPPSDLVEWDGSGGDHEAELPLKSSHFPKSALAFVDAIKKNRSCQKLLRSKMMHMEARLEEVKKLMERVKILKDFELACKKKTGRALSQKRDARVQLISVPKQRANAKFNEKKVPAMYNGPPENAHVANYKKALATFPVSVSREQWSKDEKENLMKGVKQQFQGMLLQQSIERLSDSDGPGDVHDVDSIIDSIKDHGITPEEIRLFLPEVNWEQLAAMYVPARSGAECQARFVSCEDPLINHNKWTDLEDKKLLHIVQQRGLSNWIEIAASLGTNRTPFQCLARYQRSLNASILKKEWTEEEDEELRAAVECFGESNWQDVAYRVEGRTGPQCSNRWLKTLHPARRRVGKWTAEEDKRLKVAVTLFGPKTWKKVASCVPGRTEVQCRERWVNCLDPSLNRAEWNEEEDSKLEAAFAEHGYCWSKVSACIPNRTDNQCWRRWKVLFPHLMRQHQADRKIQRAALISNFVDREAERPALGPNDFLSPETYSITGSENVDSSMKKKRNTKRREVLALMDKDTPMEIGSDEVPRLTNASEVENANHRAITRKKRHKTSNSVKKKSGRSSYGDVESRFQPQKKASKLHPRRRHVKPPKEVPETLYEVETHVPEATILEMMKNIKKGKKQADATNDHLSSDSLSVMDIREESEAICEVKTRKKKNMNQERCAGLDSVALSLDDPTICSTSVKTSREKPSSCAAELVSVQHFGSKCCAAVSGKLENSSMPSERDKVLQNTEKAVKPGLVGSRKCSNSSFDQPESSKRSYAGEHDDLSELSDTEGEDTTLASFLLRRKVCKLPKEEKKKMLKNGKKRPALENGFNNSELLDPKLSKRRRVEDEGSCRAMVEVKDGSRFCPDELLEIEYEEETTLADVYRNLKNRKTQASKK